MADHRPSFDRHRGLGGARPVPTLPPSTGEDPRGVAPGRPGEVRDGAGAAPTGVNVTREPRRRTPVSASRRAPDVRAMSATARRGEPAGGTTAVRPLGERASHFRGHDDDRPTDRGAPESLSTQRGVEGASSAGWRLTSSHPMAPGRLPIRRCRRSPHPAAPERDRFAPSRPCPAHGGRGPAHPPRPHARPSDAVPARPRPRQHRRPVRPRRHPRQGR